MSWVTMKTVIACSLPQLEQQLVHVGADAGIERAEGLVEQQDTRLLQQRLRDGKPLLHAARKLGRIAVPRRREADIARASRRRPRRAVCARPAEQPAGHGRGGEFGGQNEIVLDRQMREDRIALEDDAAIRGRLGRQRLAVDQDRAARSASPGDSSMRRKVDLPQPDAPTMVQKLPCVDVEIDPFEHVVPS